MGMQGPTTDAVTRHARTMIESDKFPIGQVSEIALKESWRKEIHHPVYHVHKWWATRLGSVFKSILIGCNLEEDANFLENFYGDKEYRDMIVFDPFMGSGTTIGEAHRLGCVAIGRDINQVACESVRVAMSRYEKNRLMDAFDGLSKRVGEEIKGMYTSVDDKGNRCDVLYFFFFWASQAPCPECKRQVDLFTSYIFGKNHSKGCSDVRIYCPKCENLFSGTSDQKYARCDDCNHTFDPRTGTTKGAKATCTYCSSTFTIIDAIRGTGDHPRYRAYAKLVLTRNGGKKYLRVTPKDIQIYNKCSDRLKEGIKNGSLLLPLGRLEDGHNTRQAINYNYLEWRDFFNDRQLLALCMLHKSIIKTSDEKTGDLLLVLFSSILEFNNMFASYKGEGTGAVRHMFSHHILKPERMPIKANVWGTPKSSGSFTNLFKSRLRKLLDYHDAPFDMSASGRVFCGKKFNGDVHTGGKMQLRDGGIFLSCGSSSRTQIPAGTVTHVITDPPFFDNVHYSELADFFYSWAKLYPRGFIRPARTTRDVMEVQDTKCNEFASKLSRVFGECNRVLKRDGMLIFTYHHSHVQGWSSLIKAVHDAGFSVINAHPVKAEMSNSVPIS